MVFETLLARVRQVGASMSGLELLKVGVGAGEVVPPLELEQHLLATFANSGSLALQWALYLSVSNMEPVAAQ